MQKIINGKLYDTEKAELIQTYYESVKYRTVFGTPTTHKDKRELYVTKNGNWFVKNTNIHGGEGLVEETKFSAKNTLAGLGNVEAYARFFEEPEEA